MGVLGDFHQIECPFSKPGYFTSVVALLGKTVTLFDAGTSSSPKRAIYPYLKRFGRTPEDISHIILTHGHDDHIDGLETILGDSKATVYIHNREKLQVLNLLKTHGFDLSRVETISHGDILTVGNRKISVIHTPGHTAGSTCFVDKKLHLCVTGDSVQGFGTGRPLLFYSTLAYAISMQNLLREQLKVFILGHPFPPFERGIVVGHEVTSMISDSLKAINILKAKIRELLKLEGTTLPILEIKRQLPGARETTINLILEELREAAS